MCDTYTPGFHIFFFLSQKRNKKTSQNDSPALFYFLRFATERELKLFRLIKKNKINNSFLLFFNGLLNTLGYFTPNQHRVLTRPRAFTYRGLI